jgi:hypothetical protein
MSVVARNPIAAPKTLKTTTISNRSHSAETRILNARKSGHCSVLCASSRKLSGFDLPWLKTAEVSQDTYLPLVNGRSLRQLSSGGMKASTNIAYYLAFFVTSLRDPALLGPSFLMLDGIARTSVQDKRTWRGQTGSIDLS